MTSRWNLYLNAPPQTNLSFSNAEQGDNAFLFKNAIKINENIQIANESGAVLLPTKHTIYH